jgi:CRP-like cAMP-binding protein
MQDEVEHLQFLNKDNDLDKSFIQDLLKLAQEKIYLPGDMIVHQGEDATSFYLLLEGCVRVIQQGKFFKEIITVLQPGDVIGINPKNFFEGSFKPIKRTADAECIGHVKALQISFSDTNKLFSQHPELEPIYVQKQKDIITNTFMSYLLDGAVVSSSVKEKISKHCDTVKLEKDEFLFRQGDDGEFAYFILDGGCEVLVTGKGTEIPQCVSTLSCGQLVGELAVIHDTKRNASIKAITSCELLRIPYREFRYLIKALPSAMKRIKKLRSFRIRPRVIDGIIMHKRLSYDGQEKVVLEHPESHQLIELPDDGNTFIQLLDGQNCLRDIVSMLGPRTEGSLDLDYYTSLVYRLLEFGYARSPSITIKLEPEMKKKPSLKEKCINLLTKEIEFTRLDETFDRLYQLVGRHICAWYGQLIMATLSLMGLVLFFPLYYRVVPHTDASLLLAILPVEFVLGWVSLLGHELAHAVATYNSGAKCYKGGFAWYWISPVGYVDTSLMWTKPLKDRLKVNLAGIYFNVFFASLLVIPAYLGWFNLYFSALAWFFTFGTLLGVLSNLSSLLEYDGYYVLMDLCNLPNLRGKSFIWLLETLPRKLKRGLNPFKQHAREIWYWVYTLFHLMLTVLVIQLIVIDIIQPIWSIEPSFLWVWNAVRWVLFCLVLWMAVRVAIQEVKEGKSIG